MVRTTLTTYSRLFFQDPFWIALHNVLHSPILLGVCLIGLGLARRFSYVSSWPAPFLLGCLLHAAVDIATHHDDGPLLLFPLDWTFRLSSPVSYWDTRYHGRLFGFFELLLDAGLLAYLLGPRVTRWLGARAPSGSPDSEPA